MIASVLVRVTVAVAVCALAGLAGAIEPEVATHHKGVTRAPKVVRVKAHAPVKDDVTDTAPLSLAAALPHLRALTHLDISGSP